MKCLISKSQIRLLFHLVWSSIVFLLLCMLYASFTWVHQFLRLQGPRTEMFLHFSSPPHFIFFLLSNILLIIWQLLVAIFYIYNVIHTLPLKRGERIREKKHIRIYYQLIDKDFIIKPILIITFNFNCHLES